MQPPLLTDLTVSFPKLVFRARWKRSAPLLGCGDELIKLLISLLVTVIGVDWWDGCCCSSSARTTWVSFGRILDNRRSGLVNGCAIGLALVYLFVFLWHSLKLLIVVLPGIWTLSRWANRATRRYLIKMDTLLCVTDFVCWTPLSSTWVASVLKVCRVSWWEIIISCNQSK